MFTNLYLHGKNQKEEFSTFIGNFARYHFIVYSYVDFYALISYILFLWYDIIVSYLILFP